MRAEVAATFTWQEQWIPRVRSIVGARLLQPADLTKDTEEATDLIVLESPGAFRVACRLRTPGYTERYRFEYTVTCRRENGWPCEWNKMVLGDWGDWMFYGHATARAPKHGKILPWYIIDLSYSRQWMRTNHGTELGPNKDPVGARCFFYAFDVRRLAREVGPHALVDWRPRRPGEVFPI